MGVAENSSGGGKAELIASELGWKIATRAISSRLARVTRSRDTSRQASAYKALRSLFPLFLIGLARRDRRLFAASAVIRPRSRETTLAVQLTDPARRERDDDDAIRSDATEARRVRRRGASHAR